MITSAEQSRNPGGLTDEARKERLALEDYRKAMQQAADRVYDQMKAELDGQCSDREATSRTGGHG